MAAKSLACQQVTLSVRPPNSQLSRHLGCFAAAEIAVPQFIGWHFII